MKDYFTESFNGESQGQRVTDYEADKTSYEFNTNGINLVVGVKCQKIIPFYLREFEHADQGEKPEPHNVLVHRDIQGRHSIVTFPNPEISITEATPLHPYQSLIKKDYYMQNLMTLLKI